MQRFADRPHTRHTLVDITRKGRLRILSELVTHGYEPKVCAELLVAEQLCPSGLCPAPIPGIVRREELAPRDGYIPVGFASWRANDAGRLRIPSFVLPEEIERASSPEETARKLLRMDKAALQRTPALRVAVKLLGMCDRLTLVPGLWGTVALEAHTGRPYTHERSDLDVLFTPPRPLGMAELQRCLFAVLELEKEFAIRIDPELSLPSGYGISLKEFLNTSTTVLGKGPRDVILIQKEDALTGLGTSPDRHAYTNNL